jgi:prepilin-type N-terminal cleavage/methylation domain-containing protein
MLRMMKSARTDSPSSKRPQRSEAGFTLIEMLVVAALVGMILVISIPMLRRSMVRAELLGEVQMLQGAIGLSRINAIKQSRQVPMRILIDNAPQKGGLVYSWIDNDGDGVQDSDEEDVGRWLMNSDVTMRPDAGMQFALLSGTARGITFLPNGSAISNAGGTVVGAGAVVVSDFASNQIRLTIQGGSATVTQEMYDYEHSLWSDQIRFWRY